MQRSPHWLQWDAPHLPPKLPLPLWRSSPQSNTLIPRLTPLTTPNGIQIQSAILPQYTLRSPDKPTDRPIDRWARLQVRYQDLLNLYMLTIATWLIISLLLLQTQHMFKTQILHYKNSLSKYAHSAHCHYSQYESILGCMRDTSPLYNLSSNPQRNPHNLTFLSFVLTDGFIR